MVCVLNFMVVMYLISNKTQRAATNMSPADTRRIKHPRRPIKGIRAKTRHLKVGGGELCSESHRLDGRKVDPISFSVHLQIEIPTGTGVLVSFIRRTGCHQDQSEPFGYRRLPLVITLRLRVRDYYHLPDPRCPQQPYCSSYPQNYAVMRAFSLLGPPMVIFATGAFEGKMPGGWLWYHMQDLRPLHALHVWQLFDGMSWAGGRMYDVTHLTVGSDIDNAGIEPTDMAKTREKGAGEWDNMFSGGLSGLHFKLKAEGVPGIGVPVTVNTRSIPLCQD
ncbi:hypothetical protein EV401DRAFT_2199016 [Pisolithus croceorrhizus]|nr:hypothetical protein EV401DRAFT_2199016 [Pisolithus croceorrhizus]